MGLRLDNKIMRESSPIRTTHHHDNGKIKVFKVGFSEFHLFPNLKKFVVK